MRSELYKDAPSKRKARTTALTTTLGTALRPDPIARLAACARVPARESVRHPISPPVGILSLYFRCAKTRSTGRFTVLRQTIRSRLQAKLKQLKYELRRRLHDPIPEVGSWLRSVLLGHMRYYGVPMNSRALSLFRFRLIWYWRRSLRRRSHKTNMTWQRMRRLIQRWLPPARIFHPYPLQRLGVITRGRSPVR